MDLVIRNARIRGESSLRDIGIQDGKIVAIKDTIKDSCDFEVAAGGRLTVPGFVNTHIHLDKCLTGERTRSAYSAGSLDIIPAAAQVKKQFSVEDIISRALRCLKLAVSHGTTAIRTFADVDSIGGLTAVKALLEVKKRVQHDIYVDIVAFPQEGILTDPQAEELLHKAMELGANIVGGIPWYEMIDEDAKKHIDIVFEIAKKYDSDIHMLIDDTDDPDSRTLHYYAIKTIREGYEGRVSASHCGALAAYNDVYAKKVISLVKRAGMTIVANPHISLMLGGRMDKQPIRRAITRVKELAQNGVNVASGQDDVDDPYYPFGRADMLEIAHFMTHAAQLNSPPEIDLAFDVVTSNGARALRLQDYGIGIGRQADLVILDAQSVGEALRMQSDKRWVIKGGKIVAETQRSTKLNMIW